MTYSSQISDNELIARYRESNDQAAFATLVQRYRPLVHAAIQRSLPHATYHDDCAQKTFALLAQKAATLPPETTLAGWLHRTAVNQARNLLRSETRRHTRETESLSPVASPNPRQQTQHSETARHLDHALQELEPDLHDAISLCYLHGLPQREAAHSLSCTESALSKRLKRARTQLRQKLLARGVKTSSAALLAYLLNLATPSSEAASNSTSPNPSSSSSPFPIAKLAFLAGAFTALSFIFTLGWKDPESPSNTLEKIEPPPAHSSPSTNPSTNPPPASKAAYHTHSLTQIMEQIMRAEIASTPEQAQKLYQEIGISIPLPLLAELKKRTLIDGAFPFSTLNAWTEASPQDAIKWLLHQTRDEPNPILLHLTLSSLYKSDPQTCAALVAAIPADHPLASEASAWLDLRLSPFAWAKTIADQPPGPERKADLHSLASAWTNAQLPDAIDWIASSSLTKDEKSELLQELLPKLAPIDPAKTILELEKLSRYADTPKTLRAVAKAIASAHPQRAPETYAQFNAPELYDADRYLYQVTNGTGAGLAHSNPALALEWLATLSGEEYSHALAGILQHDQSPETIERARQLITTPDPSQPAKPIIATLAAYPFSTASALLTTHLETNQLLPLSKNDFGPLKLAMLLTSSSSFTGDYQQVCQFALQLPTDSLDARQAILNMPCLIWNFIDPHSFSHWLDNTPMDEATRKSLRKTISDQIFTIEVTESELNFAIESKSKE